MKQTTAIIIDDMELARASLKADLKEYCPEIEIIGEADSVISAAKLLKEKTADILFLDIELGDGDGFDLLDIIPEIKSKIIFVTARQEYALKAFRYSALDYLLKPVDPQILIKTISRVSQEMFSTKDQFGILKDTLKNREIPKKIALHTSDKILVIETREIVRLEAMTNYTTFYFADGTKTLITKTLKEYDNLLNSAGFVRVHQSHLVNMDYIKAYVKTEGGYLLMKNNDIVPVSVRKKSFVINLLDQRK